MKKETSKRLTPEQQAELELLAALPDDAIDTSDAQELPDWSAAKRGLFYRPVKQQLTLRLDVDVFAWFRSHTTSHEGYQTRINRALREYVHARIRRPHNTDSAAHSIAVEDAAEQSEQRSGSSKEHLKAWWQPILRMKFDDPAQEPPFWTATNNVVLNTPFPGDTNQGICLGR